MINRQHLTAAGFVQSSQIPAFRVYCFNCHALLDSSSTPIWADTAGEPFKSYYCSGCAELVADNKIKRPESFLTD